MRLQVLARYRSYTRKGSRDVEHIGSAHTDADVALLKAAARQRLAGGQAVLELGMDVSATAQLAVHCRFSPGEWVTWPTRSWPTRRCAWVTRLVV
jgi:hypothetical protein